MFLYTNSIVLLLYFFTLVYITTDQRLADRVRAVQTRVQNLLANGVVQLPTPRIVQSRDTTISFDDEGKMLLKVQLNPRK